MVSWLVKLFSPLCLSFFVTLHMPPVQKLCIYVPSACIALLSDTTMVNYFPSSVYSFVTFITRPDLTVLFKIASCVSASPLEALLCTLSLSYPALSLFFFLQHLSPFYMPYLLYVYFYLAQILLKQRFFSFSFNDISVSNWHAQS